MFILAEGQANIEAKNINPWFDENKPIKVRIRYFGIEQWFNGLLPFTTKIPFQDNIVIINFESSDVRGSIYTTIKVCS